MRWNSPGGTYETAEVLLSVSAALVRGPSAGPLGIARAERVMVEYPAIGEGGGVQVSRMAHLRAEAR